MEKTKYVFKKSLNLTDATALVIGSMIGSGIFIVSADMARTLGSPGWLMIAWILSGVMTVFAAISYGELSKLYPNAGGQYVYLREAWNPLIGFLYGWTLFLVIQTGTIAAVGMAFAKFFGHLVPWVSEDQVLITFGKLKISTVHLVAISSIILLTWVNTNGVKAGKRIQNIFTYSKAAAMLLFIIVALLFAKNTEAIDFNLSHFWEASTYSKGTSIPLAGFALLAALGTAMVGSLFASDAWNNVGFASEEVINPKQTIAKSMLLGTIIVCVIYVITNYVYLSVLPIKGAAQGVSVFERGIQFATNDRLGTAVMSNVFDDFAAIIMAIFVVVSTFGCNNGLILSGSRVYYAMANDQLFFKKAATLNSKGVPALSLIIQCVWTCLLCLSGTYSDLLDYVIFAALLFYILTLLGTFIIRYRRKLAFSNPSIFRHYIAPILYIFVASFIIIVLLIYKSENTIPGLIIVLCGIPAFFVWKWVNKKPTS